ncbi:hypothetical protein B0H10DRAFT_2197757 [Mycena sp. CBHHK59/15]|nr:hypothetical protein B0H10DRAFT_2197757 [Mycena sp. CBHHK59/15]
MTAGSGPAAAIGGPKSPLRQARILLTADTFVTTVGALTPLRSTVRFELDPASRDAIIAAQQETRRKEGNTAEERAVLFIKVVRNTKCSAVDSNGTKCRGGPIMKPKPQAS